MRIFSGVFRYAAICFLVSFLLCILHHYEYDSAAKGIVVTNGSTVVLRIDSVGQIISENHLDCNDTNWKYDLRLSFRPNPDDSQQINLLFYFNEIPAPGDSLVVVNRSPSNAPCKANLFSIVDSLGDSINIDTFSVKLTGIPFDTAIHVTDANTNAPIVSSEIYEKHGFQFDFQGKGFHVTGKVSFVILAKETSTSCNYFTRSSDNFTIM